MAVALSTGSMKEAFTARRRMPSPEFIAGSAAAVLIPLLAFAGCQDADTDSRDGLGSETTAIDSLNPSSASVELHVRRLDGVPARFRPSGWSDERTIWGLLGGRLASVDAVTGALTEESDTAWSVAAARGVVNWRNGGGLWVMRDGAEPMQVAGAAPLEDGFDGPPDALWSPDGARAILSWRGEWDGRHALLESNGAIRRVETQIAGYFLDDAALWLDDGRVLFTTRATGPTGGEPTYRESGWRGDIAVLDLGSGAYLRVTDMPDLRYLHVAGSYGEDVLVTERDTAGVVAHWLYDSESWDRRPIGLADGRVYASQGRAAVVLLAAPSDTTNAVAFVDGGRTVLGRVGRDAEPTFSPSGNRFALRTASGLLIGDIIER